MLIWRVAVVPVIPIPLASVTISKEFKVLIVGGSVAGLTLAHCLERLGISFEVLEQGEEISPQVGASIGILPNGAFILDQLGLFEPVEKAIEPLEFARICYADGFFENQYPAILKSKSATQQGRG